MLQEKAKRIVDHLKDNHGIADPIMPWIIIIGAIVGTIIISLVTR